MTSKASPRPIHVSTYVTRAEKQLLREAAAKLGMSPSRFVREYAVSAALTVLETPHRNVGPTEHKHDGC